MRNAQRPRRIALFWGKVTRRRPTSPIPSVADFDEVLRYVSTLACEVEPELRGELNVQEFYDTYVTALEKADKVRRGEQVTFGSSTFGPTNAQAVARLNDEVSILQSRSAFLQDAARFYYIERRYQRLGLKIVIAGVVTFAAAITIVWLTRPFGAKVTAPVEERFEVYRSLWLRARRFPPTSWSVKKAATMTASTAHLNHESTPTGVRVRKPWAR